MKKTTTSHLKKRIMVEYVGGSRFQTAGIRRYVEDLKPGSNTQIGPKDFFEIACIIMLLSTVFILFSFVTSNAATFKTTQLTYNDYHDNFIMINNKGQVTYKRSSLDKSEDFRFDTLHLYDGAKTHKLGERLMSLAQINDKGQVAWCSLTLSDNDGNNAHQELLFYDGSNETRRLSTADWNVIYFHLNDNGQVIWKERSLTSRKLLFFDGNKTNHLTDDIGDLADTGYDFHIRNNGQIIWFHESNGLFFYNGKETKLAERVHVRLNDYDCPPRLNNQGQIVWIGPNENDGNINEVFYFNGSTTIQLTENTGEESFRAELNDKGQVIWTDDQGRIFICNGDIETTTQIGDNCHPSSSPAINDNGQVVWMSKGDSSDTEAILLYSGKEATPIPQRHKDIEIDPHSIYINNKGHVVWVAEKRGENSEIYLHDGRNTTQLTHNQVDEREVKINENNQVFWVNNRNDDYDIYYATYKRITDPGNDSTTPPGDDKKTPPDDDKKTPPGKETTPSPGKPQKKSPSAESSSDSGGDGGGCFIISIY